MGRNPQFLAGYGKVQEGAHLAIGLVRNLGPGIIEKRMIPSRRRNQGNPALHRHACRQDLLRALPQGIEDTHPGDGYPSPMVSGGDDRLPSMADCGVWHTLVFLTRPFKWLMQFKIAFGQLAMEGRQR